MQENVKIEKVSLGKFKITWGEGQNSDEYIPQEEMIDFVETLEKALSKMTSISRETKTEQIAVSKNNTSHRIWSYKNGMVQIEWGNLLKKITIDELKAATKNFTILKNELIEKDRVERIAFEKGYKRLYQFFILGMISLFVSTAVTALFVVFIFFVREYAMHAFILSIFCWSFFAIFYFLQQRNVKGLIEFTKDNAGEKILPMLSSIPNNRKVVEMITIFFIIFVFMSIYFSKTIPQVLNFYGNPGSIQNITD
ncbi:MAG: hypothetical protein M0R46_07725 [Candidatus Muirbacterium halophilum]|nr:hypothetical protein [Candidatus Muirbacterium halophilum]MCK9475790.1 hypothetical protein [Candidatus Muirbacterium halophilum]